MSTPEIPENPENPETPEDVPDVPVTLVTPDDPTPRRRPSRVRKLASAAALVAAGAAGFLVVDRITGTDATNVCAQADADARAVVKAETVTAARQTGDVKGAAPARPLSAPSGCWPSAWPSTPAPAPTPTTTTGATSPPSDDDAPLQAGGSDTTGVPDGVALAAGDAGTFDEDGLVIEGQHIVGDLTLTGDGQVLRNSRVEGHVIVRGAGTVVEDVEVGALSVSGATSFVGRRMDVFGDAGHDGIHITSGGDTRAADVLIEDSWIHSPQVTGDSHYDGVQVRGVDGLTLRGNTIDLGDWARQYNAAVFLENANGGNADVLVEGNVVNGGGYSLYVAGTNVSVVDNEFGRDARWGLLYPRAGDFESSGNSWADTGATVTFP